MANYNPPKENFFTTERKESLTAKLSLRVEPSLLDALKQQENWQELVRQTLREVMKARSALITDNVLTHYSSSK